VLFRYLIFQLFAAAVGLGTNFKNFLVSVAEVS